MNANSSNCYSENDSRLNFGKFRLTSWQSVFITVSFLCICFPGIDSRRLLQIQQAFGNIGHIGSWKNRPINETKNRLISNLQKRKLYHYNHKSSKPIDEAHNIRKRHFSLLGNFSKFIRKRSDTTNVNKCYNFAFKRWMKCVFVDEESRDNKSKSKFRNYNNEQPSNNLSHDLQHRTSPLELYGMSDQGNFEISTIKKILNFLILKNVIFKLRKYFDIYVNCSQLLGELARCFTKVTLNLRNEPKLPLLFVNKFSKVILWLRKYSRRFASEIRALDKIITISRQIGYSNPYTNADIFEDLTLDIRNVTKHLFQIQNNLRQTFSKILKFIPVLYKLSGSKSEAFCKVSDIFDTLIKRSNSALKLTVSIITVTQAKYYNDTETIKRVSDKLRINRYQHTNLVNGSMITGMSFSPGIVQSLPTPDNSKPQQRVSDSQIKKPQSVTRKQYDNILPASKVLEQFSDSPEVSNDMRPSENVYVNTQSSNFTEIFAKLESLNSPKKESVMQETTILSLPETTSIHNNTLERFLKINNYQARQPLESNKFKNEVYTASPEAESMRYLEAMSEKFPKNNLTNERQQKKTQITGGNQMDRVLPRYFSSSNNFAFKKNEETRNKRKDGYLKTSNQPILVEDKYNPIIHNQILTRKRQDRIQFAKHHQERQIDHLKQRNQNGMQIRQLNKKSELQQHIEHFKNDNVEPEIELDEDDDVKINQDYIAHVNNPLDHSVHHIEHDTHKIKHSKILLEHEKISNDHRQHIYETIPKSYLKYRTSLKPNSKKFLRDFAANGHVHGNQFNNLRMEQLINVREASSGYSFCSLSIIELPGCNVSMYYREGIPTVNNILSSFCWCPLPTYEGSDCSVRVRKVIGYVINMCRVLTES